MSCIGEREGLTGDLLELSAAEGLGAAVYF